MDQQICPTPRNLHDRMILDNCASLSFITVDILLVKAFAVLDFCLAVRNNV